LGPLFKKVV